MIEKSKPGGDDDDLVVTLEQGDDDFGPAAEEGVADFKAAPVVSSTLPDEEEPEEIVDGELPVQAKKEDDEPVHEDGETYAQVAQLQEQVRTERANTIWSQAQGQAAIAAKDRDTIKVGLDTLKFRLDVANRDLDAAEADGDSATARRIKEGIDDIKGLKTELEAAMRQLPDPESIIAQGRQAAQKAASEVSQGRKVGNGIQARHPLAERWAAGNGWMKTNRSANDFLIAQSAKMTSDGWDPNTPGFYAELGKRVQTAYPKLKVSAIQAQQRTPGKGQMRTPVAPGRSSTGGTPVKSVNGKMHYTLTKVEQAKMSRFNLDPKNPTHQKAWAKTRMNSARRNQEAGA